jgi:hypothetical protein
MDMQKTQKLKLNLKKPSLPAQPKTVSLPEPPPAQENYAEVADPIALRDTTNGNLRRIIPDGSLTETAAIADVAKSLKQGAVETVRLKVVRGKKRELSKVLTESQSLRVSAPPAPAEEAPSASATPPAPKIKIAGLKPKSAVGEGVAEASKDVTSPMSMQARKPGVPALKVPSKLGAEPAKDVTSPMSLQPRKPGAPALKVPTKLGAEPPKDVTSPMTLQPRKPVIPKLKVSPSAEAEPPKDVASPLTLKKDKPVVPAALDVNLSGGDLPAAPDVKLSGGDLPAAESKKDAGSTVRMQLKKPTSPESGSGAGPATPSPKLSLKKPLAAVKPAVPVAAPAPKLEPKPATPPEVSSAPSGDAETAPAAEKKPTLTPLKKGAGKLSLKKKAPDAAPEGEAPAPVAEEPAAEKKAPAKKGLQLKKSAQAPAMSPAAVASQEKISAKGKTLPAGEKVGIFWVLTSFVTFAGVAALVAILGYQYWLLCR